MARTINSVTCIAILALALSSSSAPAAPNTGGGGGGGGTPWDDLNCTQRCDQSLEWGIDICKTLYDGFDKYVCLFNEGIAYNSCMNNCRGPVAIVY